MNENNIEDRMFSFVWQEEKENRTKKDAPAKIKKDTVKAILKELEREYNNENKKD